MTRYIDADKLTAHLDDEIKECVPPFFDRANGKSIAYGTVLGLKSAIAFAEALTTADVVEVKHGEWIDNTNGTFTCSVCGGKSSKMAWCGRCGAKMDGRSET